MDGEQVSSEENKNKPSKYHRFLKKPRVLDPYKYHQEFAKYIKVRIQMLIGSVLLVLIFGYIIHNAFIGSTLLDKIPSSLRITSDYYGFYGNIIHPLINSINIIVSKNIVEIVADALYLSMAIDLAYMLFTPALDEAVEPLISGLAATILLALSSIHKLSDVSLEAAGGIALLGLVLAILFIIRRFAADEEKESNDSKKKPAEDK